MARLDPRELKPCGEQYDRYKSAATKKWAVQYDYRAANGILFSCVAPTIEGCVAKRDMWLEAKGWEA